MSHAVQSCPVGVGDYELFTGFAEATQWLIDNYFMASPTPIPPTTDEFTDVGDDVFAPVGDDDFEDYTEG